MDLGMVPLKLLSFKVLFMLFNIIYIKLYIKIIENY